MPTLDPKDDKSLEVAVNGQAALIVSGDRNLLDLGRFQDVPIATAAVHLQG